MKYRHLLPEGTKIVSAITDPENLRNQIEFEWLLWQRNIDPLQVVETGLICSFNAGEFVIHEYEFMGGKNAVRYEKLSHSS
jgi:hypothetical protein